MANGEISHEWKEGGAEGREGWLIDKGCSQELVKLKHEVTMFR